MKKLQTNFTTPEQSKRLLELGVPANSADCYLKEYYIMPIILNKIPFSDFVSATTKCIMNKPEDYLPCWSVGRLIEIYITCIEHYTRDERLTFGRDTVRLGMIDCIIAAIEVGCDDGDIDFSKLED